MKVEEKRETGATRSRKRELGRVIRYGIAAVAWLEKALSEPVESTAVVT